MTATTTPSNEISFNQVVTLTRSIVNTLTAEALESAELFSADFFQTKSGAWLRVEVALVEGEGLVYAIGDGMFIPYFETLDYNRVCLAAAWELLNN